MFNLTALDSTMTLYSFATQIADFVGLGGTTGTWLLRTAPGGAIILPDSRDNAQSMLGGQQAFLVYNAPTVCSGARDQATQCSR